jgi:hypothetical protein
VFASILELADGFTQWREVGEEGPGSLELRRPFLTLLAVVVRCIGCGRWGDKRLIAAGTNGVLEWADSLPAGGTEERHRVGGEGLPAREAFNR